MADRIAAIPRRARPNVALDSAVIRAVSGKDRMTDPSHL